MALLGIDLGTSAVKVMVMDTQGHVLSLSKNTYRVMSRLPGGAESDLDEWWAMTVPAVRRALAEAPNCEITAIGLAGQMHGVALIDEVGRGLRAAILWPDRRALTELERYRNLSQSFRKRLANPLVAGMAGPLLCWLAEHEAPVYRKARWALQPKDWLRMRLTGEIATDPGDASGTLLYDLPGDNWADDIVAALGLERRLLPPIRSASAIGGRLLPKVARLLGLPAGLPVAVGAADTAAALLGSGLHEYGPIQLTLGTGAQFVQLRERPVADRALRIHLYRAADSVNWYAMAAVQNAGLALDWVSRLLRVSWDDLYESINTVPLGSNGLFFLPYLTGERAYHPLPAQCGGFIGLRMDHGSEDLRHAALEGVAFGLRVALEVLAADDRNSPLWLVGGGSEHPGWRQMLADVLNRELLIIDTSAASARGAALLGGIASGVWANARATAAVAPRVSLSVVPDVRRAMDYSRLYVRYLELSKGVIGHVPSNQPRPRGA